MSTPQRPTDIGTQLAIERSKLEAALRRILELSSLDAAVTLGHQAINTLIRDNTGDRKWIG